MKTSAIALICVTLILCLMIFKDINPGAIMLVAMLGGGAVIFFWNVE